MVSLDIYTCVNIMIEDYLDHIHRLQKLPCVTFVCVRGCAWVCIVRTLNVRFNLLQFEVRRILLTTGTVYSSSLEPPPIFLLQCLCEIPPCEPLPLYPRGQTYGKFYQHGIKVTSLPLFSKPQSCSPTRSRSETTLCVLPQPEKTVVASSMCYSYILFFFLFEVFPSFTEE